MKNIVLQMSKEQGSYKSLLERATPHKGTIIGKKVFESFKESGDKLTDMATKVTKQCAKWEKEQADIFLDEKPKTAPAMSAAKYKAMLDKYKKDSKLVNTVLGSSNVRWS